MENKQETYSQLEQDIWIRSKFPKDYIGYFVDIGANDGISISNTYLLEKNGWIGICVEPSNTEFNKLQENRTSRNYKACVADFNGKCIFNENGFFGKISSKYTGETECYTLEYILETAAAPTTIDYLSIDVEGGEYDIIKNFPFDKYFIKYITIEHNAYGLNFELKNNISSVLLKYFDIEKENVGTFEDWYVNKLINKQIL